MRHYWPCIIHNFSRCLDDKDCQFYQYQPKGTRPGNCILIHCTQQDAEEFGNSDNSELLMKGMLLYEK